MLAYHCIKEQLQTATYGSTVYTMRQLDEDATMTKKDRKLIAAAMRNAVAWIEKNHTDPLFVNAAIAGVEVAAMSVADELWKENPMFNRVQFESDCGIY